LHGELVRSDDYPSYPVIVGRTALGQEISLIDCTRAGVDMRYGVRGMHSEESIRCTTVVRGRHIRRPGTAKWDSAVFTFDNLDAWAARGPFVQHRPGGVDPDGTVWQEVRLESLPSITASLSTGDVEIRQGAKSSIGVDEFSSSRSVQIVFRPTAAMTFEEIEQFVAPMRYFLIFATGARCRVRSMSVAAGRDRSIRSLTQLEVLRAWSVQDPQARRDYDMLLPLRSFSERAHDVLGTWFDSFGARRHALDLLLSASTVDRQFLETRFLAVAQAAEVYHRAVFPGGVLAQDAHDERVTATLDSAPQEHVNWLRGRLEHSNEPSLKARLDALLKYSGLDDKGLVRRKLSRVAADTRNYHTHYDSRLRSRAAAGTDMYWLTQELRGVLDVCLLRDLGFDETVSWNCLRDSLLGRSLRFKP
jgi:hypothetical protein